jgi:hypothetical protein
VCIVSLVTRFSFSPSTELVIIPQFKNQFKMEKKTITISNPNPYKSKETETAMVSYVVTGEGKEQYRQDQLAKGIDSTDDNGNPLIHFTAKASAKYGQTAVLERAVLENGDVIWYDPTTAEEKQVKELIAGMDETTKALYAQEELAKVRAFAKTLIANRQANIAKLMANQSSGKIDNLGK